jgi:hypothetical protein
MYLSGKRKTVMNKKTEGLTAVSMSTTSCRQCVFAHYNKNKQEGCLAGRLDILRDNGVEIIEVQDDEKEFCLIKDKACSYFRHRDQYQDSLNKIGAESLVRKVKETLKIPYHVILFLRASDSIEDLDKRLLELYDQKVRPSLVTVLDRSHSTIDLTPKIVGLFHRKYRFDTWRTQRVAALDISDLSALDVGYDNTKSIKYFFYTIFEVSNEIPSQFSEEIHDAIQERSEAFVVLESGRLQEHGHTVLKAAHEKYAGNSFEVDLRDKIMHYNDSAHLIRKVEELCPSIKTC